MFERWRKLSITTKFSSAFTLLLVLNLLVVITSYVALTIVRRETEAAILTGTEIQGLVLEMDRDLQEAHVLQRDFFLQYPLIGFAEARQVYALKAVQKMAGVVTLSKDLQQRIATSDVSTALRERNVDLNLYLSAAERYADTFLESVELVTQLAAPETGLEAQLAQHSALLQDILQTDGQNLITLYQDMKIFEKDYLVTRQRPVMQSALNVAFQLRQAIEDTPTLTIEQKAQAQTHLDNYRSIAEDIVELDVDIRSKLNDFNLQAEAVNPISVELIILAKGEVERAQTRITRANQLAATILVVIALGGLLLVLFIAKILNNSITRNVVKLTEAAGELQAGNLEVSAQIDSADELGRLAGSFNDMAARINTLVNNLEQQVVARTHKLETVATLSGQLNAILDVDQLLAELVNQVKERFNYYHVHIYLLDDNRQNLVMQAGAGEAGQKLKAQEHHIPLTSEVSLVARAGRTGEIVRVDNVRDSPDWLPNPLLPDTYSEMAVPIVNESQVIGVLDVQSDRVAGLDDVDANLLRSVANHVAVALTNARLFEQNQAALAETKTLYTISRRMIRANNLSDLIVAVAEEIAIPVIDRAVLGVFSYDDQGELDTMSIQANWSNGQGPEPTPLGTRYSRQAMQTLDLFLSSEPLFFNNVQQDKRMNRVGREVVRHLNIRAMMVLPLWGRKRQLGALLLESEEAYHFTKREIRPYQSMLGQLTTAMENQQLFEQMQQARDAAETARSAAEAANRAKSAFLANISHELRTPLNAILGFSQLMERDATITPKQRDNLGIISHSGEHLLELINDVLEISKIEAGQVTFIETDFDLYQLLATLESMFGVHAKNKGLQLHFEHPADIPQYIRTDERKLRQVLINLLNNAVKFTREGRVTLRVTTNDERKRALAPDPLRVSTGVNDKMDKNIHAKRSAFILLIFEVSDTGPGIAPEEMDQLFEAFTQTTSGQEALEGTGLGLPLSRRFVQLMGGDITVESPPPTQLRISVGGPGSLFRFDIQVALPADVSKIQNLKSKIQNRVIGLAPEQRAADGHPYRILVAEDREESRMLLVQLLTAVGFEVRKAVNGQEAVATWESWQPHLIWMDMRMPVMDGYEATKIIKSKQAKTRTEQSRSIQNLKSKIIALTAHAFEEERAAILAAGCDDFVRKPFKEAAIFDKMAQYLGVRYIYEAPEQPVEQDSDTPAQAPLTADALAGLPANWVAGLNRAVSGGRAGQIFELLEQIEADHPALTGALAKLVEEYRFEELIALTTRKEI